MDELKTALELATDEELQHLTQILFCRKFNPLDYWQTPEPFAVQNQSRGLWLRAIEDRFRYLAADGLTVLKGQTRSLDYRGILLKVCHFLKLSYDTSMSATDLEAEIFLHLTGKAWQKLPQRERSQLLHQVRRSLANTDLPEPLPVQLQHNPLTILLRGTGTLAINTVLKSFLLKAIAREFAIHFAGYQMAKTVALEGAAQLSTVLAAQAAKREMAATALRYGAARTIFSLLGPALWGMFLADLGWRAIATNYGRIIPTIVTLAQIRLTREEYAWQTEVNS